MVYNIFVFILLFSIHFGVCSHPSLQNDHTPSFEVTCEEVTQHVGGLLGEVEKAATGNFDLGGMMFGLIDFGTSLLNFIPGVGGAIAAATSSVIKPPPEELKCVKELKGVIGNSTEKIIKKIDQIEKEIAELVKQAEYRQYLQTIKVPIKTYYGHIDSMLDEDTSVAQLYKKKTIDACNGNLGGGFEHMVNWFETLLHENCPKNFEALNETDFIAHKAFDCLQIELPPNVDDVEKRALKKTFIGKFYALDDSKKAKNIQEKICAKPHAESWKKYSKFSETINHFNAILQEHGLFEPSTCLPALVATNGIERESLTQIFINNAIQLQFIVGVCLEVTLPNVTIATRNKLFNKHNKIISDTTEFAGTLMHFKNVNVLNKITEIFFSEPLPNVHLNDSARDYWEDWFDNTTKPVLSDLKDLYEFGWQIADGIYTDHSEMCFGPWCKVIPISETKNNNITAFFTLVSKDHLMHRPEFIERFKKTSDCRLKIMKETELNATMPTIMQKLKQTCFPFNAPGAIPLATLFSVGSTKNELYIFIWNNEGYYSRVSYMYADKSKNNAVLQFNGV